MHKTDFYGLPRPTQERFIDGTRRLSIPVSLAVKQEYRPEPYYWFGLAVLIFVIWILIAKMGYADLNHSWAIGGTLALVIHIALAAGFAYGLLRGASGTWERRALPFKPGTYLFPGCIVSARSTKFTVYEVDEFVSIVRQDAPPGVRIQLQNGKAYFFRVTDPAKLDQVMTHLEQAKGLYHSARQSSDTRELSMLDPLVDSGLQSPIGSNEPLKRRRLMPRWLTIVVTVAAGGFLGWVSWSVRNELSERALYKNAIQDGSANALEKYLKRGGQRQHVRDILLPRAELVEAIKTENVEAVEKYIETHKNSKIQKEVDAAYRHVLLQALEKAKQAGTVSALTQFHEAHAGSKLVEAEWLAARKAVYKRALDAFAKVAQPKNPDIVPFMRHLLSEAEEHGPNVQIRFAHSIPKTWERVDSMISKSPYYMGKVHRPSQYFDAKHSIEQEKRMGQALIARLQKAFAPDVLKFEMGPRIADFGKDLPVPKLPTLFLEHKATLSGGYINIRPRGVFVGAALNFEATFVLPSGGALLVSRYSVWRPPDLSVYRKRDAEPSEIYETMVTGAFDRFEKRIVDAIFAESK